MSYGTAPRRIGGVWYTREGRRLNAGGQRYWSRKKQQGFTDGAGHVNRSSVVGAKAPGLVEKGNIDIRHRPHVRNRDGSVSTVRSITVTDDRGAHVIPTVVGNRVVSNQQAIAHWRKTGQHLGRFKTEAQANSYAQRLHEQQASTLSPPRAPEGPRFEPVSGKEAAYHRAHPRSQPTAEQLDAKYIGPKIKKAGYDRGVLNKIASPFTRPLNQIGESAYYSPAGIYQAGRAGVKDVGAARHGDYSFKRTRALGKGIAKATVEDFKHPRERSGYLALDIAGAVSAGAGTASRIAAAGKAASETGRIGAVAKALAHAPEPKPRTLRSGKLEAHPLESRNKALAAVQRLHDATVNKAAARNPEGRIGRSYLPKKVGKTLAEERRLVTEPAAKAPAGALAKQGKKLSDAQQHAFRIVAEQAKGKAQRAVTVAERHAFHVAQGDKRSAKLTELASRYLQDTPEGPKIRREYTNLQEVYDRLVKVARNRDELLHSIGRLSEEGSAERVAGPARIIGGAKHEPKTLAQGAVSDFLTTGRKVRPTEATGAAPAGKIGVVTSVDTTKGKARVHFYAKGVPDQTIPLDRLRSAASTRKGQIVGADDLKGAGEVRIPYAKQPAAKSLLRAQGMGAGTTIGGVRNPGSLTHSFTGSLLRKGGGRRDVTKLVAESNVEAQRLGAGLRVRDQIRAAAVPHPPERGAKDYVAIRLDNPMATNLPAHVRSLIQDATRKQEEGIKLSRAERQALSSHHEDARRSFVYGSAEEIGKLSPAEQAEFVKLYDAGKIGWVNRRLLGGMDKPQQLTGPGVRAAASTADTINNAFRAAVLYLKPAYAAPNLLGNAALNIVQQGFAAPFNLARAARINGKLSHEAAAKLDATMGEGFVAALRGEGGIGRKAIDAAANVWSKGVDVPFRRSAFIYEARRHLRDYGPRADWRKIENLLTDPSRADELSGVVRRANREIIDYGRLGPTEREIVRRAILFFPWVKGSTLYAGRFITEHPIKAAATAKVGEQGKQFADETLGPVPSRYKGSFKAAGGLVNPASAAILGTPAQVVDAARGVVAGNVQEAGKLASFASPTLGLLSAELSRVDPDSGFAYPARDSALDIAKDQLVDSTPQAALVRNLKGDFGKVLQPTRGQALGKFGVGGLYPQRYNPDELAKAARKEQRSLMSPVKRATSDASGLRKEMISTARATGLIKANERLPKWLDKALVNQAAIHAAYAKAGIKSGISDYQEKAWKVDVATLLRQKRITKAQAFRAEVWALDKSSEQIERERTRIRAKYFGGAVLSDARHDLTMATFVNAVRKAGKQGKLTPAQVQSSINGAEGASLTDLRAAIEQLHKKLGIDVAVPELR